MELVISISRVTRFVRVGGNTLGAKLPTNGPFKPASKLYTNQPANRRRVLLRPSERLSIRQAVQTASGLKRRPRLLSHMGLSLAVVSLVVVGGLHAGQSSTTNQASQPASPLSSLATEGGFGGVSDETASAYIAASVAQEVELPVAEKVIEDVQKLTTQVSYSATGDSSLSKPQMISTEGALARGIQTYVVKEGDTVASIATSFDISTDTVRWANNIPQDSEPAIGDELTILPVSGVLHKVSDTDTPEGLALLYQTSAELIIRYNDAEVDGLIAGSTVVVPNGVIDTSPQVSSLVATSRSFSPNYAGNGYAYGWCTWHAANRRAASGRPIPSNWGNAISWKYNAIASGYGLGTVPRPGAVVYHNDRGGWGHVAYVETVYPDGSAKFSDMNWVGWGITTSRTVPAAQMGNYTFIY